MLNQCLYEMLNSANQAWTMYPGLTHGAYERCTRTARDEQKKTYLPKLTSGEWTGTMCLTEAHCGTDLGLLRTKAEPQADGSYKLTGNKIFISAGEHDMAENIVHLVLARLPGCAAGHQGHLAVHRAEVHAERRRHAGRAQRASTAAASSTRWASTATPRRRSCSTAPPAGWSAQPNKGLQAMFVMMNAARLGVGNQSLGLTEVAYQNALAYAKERIQMRSLSGPKAKDKPADPIIVHPDVRKMLLTAKAYAEGGRALAIYFALLIDKELSTPTRRCARTAAERSRCSRRSSRPSSPTTASSPPTHCMQVFGGHGYIREWGMEQFVRDNRINMIYEGTNTIQSLDLLGRKVLGNNGATLKKFGKLLAQLVEEEGVNETMAEFINPLAELGDQMHQVHHRARHQGASRMPTRSAPPRWTTCASPATWCSPGCSRAWRRSRCAKQADPATAGDPFYAAKLQTARFYFAKLLPETASLIRSARAGAKLLMDTGCGAVLMPRIIGLALRQATAERLPMTAG